MAIDNTTVVPKLVAAALLRQFYNDRVYSARVNNTWRNMLNPYGDSIIINRPDTGTEGGSGTVGDYNKTDISYGAADVGSPLTLTMDKVKYWSVQFDDLDRAVSRIDLLQESVKEYGTRLAEVVDKDVRTKQTAGALNIKGQINANTSAWANDGVDFGDKAALDAITINDLELDVIHRIMDVQNIPMKGRWAIVNPYFAQLVRRAALNSERILTNPSTSIGKVVSNGLMGEFGGFMWYVDSGNHVTKGTVSADPDPTKKIDLTQDLLFGVDSAVAFIDQIRKTERLRLEKRFSDAVRGLYKYGAQLVYDRRLFKAEFKAKSVLIGPSKANNIIDGPLQSTGTSPALA